MIYTITLNPALDKTVILPEFCLDTVNRIQELRTDPGGKGINVSKVIRELGGESIAMGILGGETGSKIEKELKQMGLRTDFLYVDGETRTNLKIVDPVNHTNTDINEPGVKVNEEILERLLSKLLHQVKSGDIVVLSGSIPKGAPKDTYAVWIRELKKHHVRTILDADGDLLTEGLKALPDLAKPNNDELSRISGKKLETLEELCSEAVKLTEKGIRNIVVSMGSEGALFVTEEKILYAEGLKVPVGSTVGAGDSVVAALAYAWEKKLSLEETVRLSMATGAANVMCSGTQAAEYGMIERLLGQVTYHVMKSV